MQQKDQPFFLKAKNKQEARILVVVKEISIAQNLEPELPKNMECIATNSGFAALDLIEMWKPSLVVIDDRISDMLYDALCSQMRFSRYMADVPIIILSQRRGLFDKYRCVEAGASDYINTPISSTALANRIMRTLNISMQHATTSQAPQRIVRNAFVHFNGIKSDRANNAANTAQEV